MLTFRKYNALIALIARTRVRAVPAVHAVALLAAAVVAGCASGGARRLPPAGASVAMTDALRIVDQYRVDAITLRRIPYAAYWQAIAPSLRSPRLRTDNVGLSMQGRPLRTVTFGSGRTTVLLWSQMHGDEATATMALADIMAWMAAPGADALRDRVGSALTVVMLPMLNPDGAERFQRENAAGIDINRDARALSSPEAQTLKAVHDRLKPAFGFNLHDQNARTRAGNGGLPSGIALLAPAADAAKSWGPVRTRARHVAALLARDFGGQIAGRVAKYDDTFNARAFGDLIQSWGTSTVLIESGALPNDPQKQSLRRLNAAAIISALDAIATDRYASVDTALYDRLPFNAGGAYDVLVRGASLVMPGMPMLRADIAINYDDAVARTGGRVREVGDLSDVVAIDTVNAENAYLHPRGDALTGGGSAAWLTIGARAAFDLREGREVDSKLRRRFE